MDQVVSFHYNSYKIKKFKKKNECIIIGFSMGWVKTCNINIVGYIL